jgi:hypothetical protein
MSEGFRVVTSYRGHALLGDWESATRRPMTMERATRYVAQKMNSRSGELTETRRRHLESLGEFRSIRIEPVETGR